MSDMKYVTIHDRQVPALGFGTWRLTGEECVKAVEHALEVGYRHIDTAQFYANEAEVGQGIENCGVGRDHIFLVTKTHPDNYSRQKVISSTEDSLRKLKTEYIDLLLMHWHSPGVPIEETLGAMTQLQDGGKIRHIGVSNFPASLVERAAECAPIFCNQVEYHPFLSQARLLEQARRMDYLLTAYCPLARGKVTGDDTLKQIGETHGKTAEQVALRWLIQQEKVCAIPKSASAQRRTSNFDIFDFELSDVEMRAIHNLSRAERLVKLRIDPEEKG